MRRAKSYVAGMEGNRTHPGRLSSAPQTVLKTAGLASASVHQGPPKFDRLSRESIIVRARPQISVGLAVNLAVSEPSKPSGDNLVQRAPGTVSDDLLESPVDELRDICTPQPVGDKS